MSSEKSKIKPIKLVYATEKWVIFKSTPPKDKSYGVTTHKLKASHWARMMYTTTLRERFNF